MSATFDPSLPRALDHIRFWIGDTDVSAPKVQDETILAVLGEFDDRRYCAAAQLLESMQAGSLAGGGRIIEKKVGDLTIRWDHAQSSGGTVADRIKALRARCVAEGGTASQLLFKVLGP